MFASLDFGKIFNRVYKALDAGIKGVLAFLDFKPFRIIDLLLSLILTIKYERAYKHTCS
jgi:hypothetical protein